MLKRKSIAVTVDDNGEITAYASTFTREPDWAGDVVAKSAFANWLNAYHKSGATMPMLYNHDQRLESFIGKVAKIGTDEHGLLFTAEFDATENAQRARELAKDGRLAKLSFAYEVRDQATVTLEDGRKANELRELWVSEVSLVLNPCNPDTSVVDVKSKPLTIELHPRIEGLTDEQREEFTKAIAEATHNGLEIGLKAGRRNSKADADELRRIRDAAQRIITAIDGLLADEDTADEQEPSGGPDPDANAKEPDTAKAKEPTDEDAARDLLAKAQALIETL